MYRACLVNLHLITVLGQADPGMVWDISYSFGSDIFVEPGHIWSPHLLHGKFPELSECPRGALLETRSMDRLMNVDDVSLVTPLLMAECPFFSPPFLVGAIMLGPSWKDRSQYHNSFNQFLLLNFHVFSRDYIQNT